MVNITFSSAQSTTYDTSLDIITKVIPVDGMYIQRINQMNIPPAPNCLKVTASPVHSLTISLNYGMGGINFSEDTINESGIISLNNLVTGELNFKASGFSVDNKTIHMNISKQWQISTNNKGRYTNILNTSNLPVGNYSISIGDQQSTFILSAEAPSHSISGTVYYNGDPVEGFSIELYEWSGPPENNEPMNRTLIDTYVTGINGTYIFSNLTSQSYELRPIIEDPTIHWQMEQIPYLNSSKVENFYLNKKIQMIYPLYDQEVSEVSPILEWEPSQDADEYSVWLRDYESNTLGSWTTSDSFFQIPIELIPNDRFSIILRGYSSEGVRVSYEYVYFDVSEDAGPTIYHHGVLDTWTYKGNRRNFYSKVLESSWMVKELVGDRLKLTLSESCLITRSRSDNLGKLFDRESTIITDRFYVYPNGKILLRGLLHQDTSYWNGVSRARRRFIVAVIDPTDYNNQLHIRYKKNNLRYHIYGSILP